jgi:peptidyl-prolyl cis-trans isomerase-like 1
MPKAVILETSMGPVTFEMYDKHAPQTCRNFIELANRGYYNGQFLQCRVEPLSLS